MTIKFKKGIVLIFLFFCVNILSAQIFERFEHISGLGIMEENSGVAVADYDGDLDLDIFIVAKAKDVDNIEITHSRLFRNNSNNTFTDVTEIAGLSNLFPKTGVDSPNPALQGYKYGASWGDYDNDGFPDLFLTNQYKLQLFRNQGNGTFVDVTKNSGITPQNTCWYTGATWFDFNNDGYLDLYISEWENCSFNTFYLNNGDGTFTNQSALFAQTTPNNRSYASVPFDFNSDGWFDLYLSNDNSLKNDLYINQNGISVSEEAINYGVDHTGHDMGIAFHDYNNDGFFDIFITDINDNTFYKNNGDNTFIDIASNLGVKDTGWAWDVVFADFDLDGDEDLFVVNGFNIPKAQYNFYFENTLSEGQLGFINKTDEANLKALNYGVGATPFDFDNDGDLDLYTTNSDSPSFFYKNTSISNRNQDVLKWFKVSLEGVQSNKNAVGTVVSVVTDVGTFHRYYTGIGFLSQSILPVHFGLKNATLISELKIKWPSGLEETHKNLQPNTYIKAKEGQGFEILNIPFNDVVFGCTNPNSCTYNPDATEDDGSCVYFDLGNISGSKQSAFNTIETYSVNLNANSEVIWTVEGGEIIEGQGTSTIKVKWGFHAAGKLSVYQKNNTCVSNTNTLNVQLHLSRLSKDISVARIWNEALLEAIRKDFARPNVHARNLFHMAIALFDAWAIYNQGGKPYLMGNSVNNFESKLEPFTPNESAIISSEKAMSFAAYRLLMHRFKNSPGWEESSNRFNLIMSQLGYVVSNTSIDYQSGDAAALGNFIGQTIINYGLNDGSRESFNYEYVYYQPVNEPLDLAVSGIGSGLVNCNRWQPLTFNTFIDQSGNLINGSTPKFLGPEWGQVKPFALTENEKSVHRRDGQSFNVFHDPGRPPQLDINAKTQSGADYQWNFALVSLWSSHLDPSDGVLWDISPRSIGNIDINLFTTNFSDLPNYYNAIEGGDISKGHDLNPVTGQAYQPQMVPRADYARVLAEFWADGPDSETPPGHWFTILNYVSDHPLLVKKMNGEGDELSPLEWDVKSYFTLAGAMHDAAIAAWGIKGWYDYIRPISAIRYMSELGQSTDENLPNYHVGGMPLKAGFIELVEAGDVLSGENNEHLGKIKVLSWKGHEHIKNAQTDVAGVDWILAEDWWPYQRPSFVTPPFAGYISGHSTFSRAAAEVLTLFTGDAFFPGGMGEFVAKKDAFLVFEKGPSVDVKLQWATYRDASDQTSLSRIWGGIHPPADDIPGRLIGARIGKSAYHYASAYFKDSQTNAPEAESVVYPNPVHGREIHITHTTLTDQFMLFDVLGHAISISNINYNGSNGTTTLVIPNSLESGIYVLRKNEHSNILIID
ncbi:FG-GAP-like repeat-containing protein [Tamlana sp. I1]|uniref:FG-GAP-like repeat-containing protein n=1 Tax=Tamlana sp. I1 TaxID=2762061 RepID=UPI00188F955D|nr:FG-GAP-like repeat-containing protein [Tamlana sp. I1]